MRRHHWHENKQHSLRYFTGEIFELLVKIALLTLLLSWSLILLRPFLSIFLWTVILTITLYPVFLSLTRLLGGYRGLAAIVVVVLGLLVLIGPIIWLGVSAIESLNTWSAKLNAGSISVPPPPDEVKSWPLIGERAFQAWSLASKDMKAALDEALPRLSPMRDMALQTIKGAATGVPVFLLSLIAAGFLFAPAPALVETMTRLSRHLLPSRGQEFVALAGTTIRNVSQGVIGIALLQAILAGVGFVAAGIPGSGALAIGVLIAAILQLPGIVLIPVAAWSWTAMSPLPALALSVFLVAVALINNVLGPLVMSHGLKTPKLLMFAGVIGGALAHGIIGLFVGPIVLAVTWELITAWFSDEDGGIQTGARFHNLDDRTPARIARPLGTRERKNRSTHRVGSRGSSVLGPPH